MVMANFGNKWYIAGLHFDCSQCSNCCSGPGEGFIWATKQEIKFIADFLKMPEDKFRKKYTKRKGQQKKDLRDIPSQTEPMQNLAFLVVKPR